MAHICLDPEVRSSKLPPERVTQLPPAEFHPSPFSGGEGEGPCQLPTRAGWGNTRPRSCASSQDCLRLSPGEPRARCQGAMPGNTKHLSQLLPEQTAPGVLFNQPGCGSYPLQPVPKILCLESVAGEAPREAVCSASPTSGQPWQQGKDGHMAMHLCAGRASHLLFENIWFCRRE